MYKKGVPVHDVHIFFHVLQKSLAVQEITSHNVQHWALKIKPVLSVGPF
jgi:hypothetical protein